jgi:hypothetical protein
MADVGIRLVIESENRATQELDRRQPGLQPHPPRGGGNHAPLQPDGPAGENPLRQAELLFQS